MVFHEGDNTSELGAAAISRRKVLRQIGSSTLAVATTKLVAQDGSQTYQPIDPVKKLRIGVVGGGFGSAFPWHRHPNCEVAAVAELRDDRRRHLMETFHCNNAYGEFHPMLKDPKVVAVAMFTGAPSHVPYCVDTMDSGKHVICAVPAAIGLDECQQLVDAVRKTGQIYMNAETGCFRTATMAAHALRRQGKLGTIYHSEGAYLHDVGNLLLSNRVPKDLMDMLVYEGKPTWRQGNAPGYYSTHATGPVILVTGEKLVAVTSQGVSFDHPFYKSNQYYNPFICETMFCKTSGGHSSRISLHFWTTEPYREGADYFGTQGSFFEPWIGHPASVSYKQAETADAYGIPDYASGLPPALREFTTAGHGGAEAFIVHEFVSACIQQRKPAVDVYKAVAFAAPGICGHESAMHGGEWVNVPDFGPIS
jgi:predicted dehydrogenase